MGYNSDPRVMKESWKVYTSVFHLSWYYFITSTNLSLQSS